MTQKSQNYSLLIELLLTWYDHYGRDLPWRVKGKAHPTPYFVWLSEIMLQQTTVATVKGYFDHFTHRWPTLEDLAQASLDEILHSWQGLGYYARARNMYKCAQYVVNHYQGVFPSSYEELLTLPGIGPYTAAAIAAIAFNQQIVPIDGNVIRVLSRLFALQEELPLSLPSINEEAKNLAPIQRASDFAQALMDLGATLCTPRHPKCLVCPWQSHCQAYQQGLTEVLPRKAPRLDKPIRYGVAFYIKNAQGAILLRKRPPKGLLGGMIEVPSTEWRPKSWTKEEALSFSPLPCRWSPDFKEVTHTFTHFHLKLTILKGQRDKFDSSRIKEGFWVAPKDLGHYALPTLMKKILNLKKQDLKNPLAISSPLEFQ